MKIYFFVAAFLCFVACIEAARGTVVGSFPTYDGQMQIIHQSVRGDQIFRLHPVNPYSVDHFTPMDLPRKVPPSLPPYYEDNYLPNRRLANPTQIVKDGLQKVLEICEKLMKMVGIPKAIEVLKGIMEKLKSAMGMVK